MYKNNSSCFPVTWSLIFSMSEDSLCIVQCQCIGCASQKLISGQTTILVLCDYEKKSRWLNNWQVEVSAKRCPCPTLGRYRQPSYPSLPQSFLLILPQPATGTHYILLFSEPLLIAIISTNSWKSVPLLLCFCYFVLLCATVCYCATATGGRQAGVWPPFLSRGQCVTLLRPEC